MNNVGDLSNEQLLARLRAHVGKGHVWQAQLIAYLAEVERRRLEVAYACPSMWELCIGKLGMSESEAKLRIAAARIVRRFASALGYLARGEIHLCALYALRDHLTEENHEELLRAATGKTTEAVKAVIAARFPKPDVPARVEPLRPQVDLPVTTSVKTATSSTLLSASLPAPERRPRVEPLSSTRYRVELTVSAESKAKLERIKDLMRHRNPRGDLETIVDASLDLLLAKLEKERLGKTARPKRVTAADVRTVSPAAAEQALADPGGSNTATSATSANGARATTTEKSKKPRRYTSRADRREVFARDGEQCTYLAADGHRCPARGGLELDHIIPKALGGSDEASNLRVRCRAHNQFYAEQIFGRAHVEKQIQLRRAKSGRRALPSAGAGAPSAFQTAQQALRLLGFREAEVRRAVATLEARLDPETPIEMIVREGLLLLT